MGVERKIEMEKRPQVRETHSRDQAKDGTDVRRGPEREGKDPEREVGRLRKRPIEKGQRRGQKRLREGNRDRERNENSERGEDSDPEKGEVRNAERDGDRPVRDRHIEGGRKFRQR